ncbi:hypothetical protein GJ744_001089 [Endocarpon pusillum]|uniref:Uncharacterized protein n=1 Tax=Endocarpon pusillum TaxID=364733 RepID=A0A8H7E0W4_9EURO|nr:hypothetical protein GJ744_001089 [Endocarpon pusillum]
MECAIEEEAEPSNVKGWWPLGQAHASTCELPSDQPSRGTRHDWALVTINKNANLRPNRLRPTTLGKLREADLLAPSSEKMELSRSRHVALNTYGERCQTGTLGYLPCSVWLNRSAGFVKAFPLKMNEGAHIKRGDSGGWVVEYYTLEVYGHLVSSDVLGDGYVIPLLDTLEDIRERTHAQDVGLATGLDITCKLGDALIPEISTEGGSNSAQDIVTHLATANRVEEQNPLRTLTRYIFPQLREPATRCHDSGYASAYVSPFGSPPVNVTPLTSPSTSRQTDVTPPSTPKASTPSLTGVSDILDETPGSSLQQNPIPNDNPAGHRSKTQPSEGRRKGLTKALSKPQLDIRERIGRPFGRFR